jgi:Ice-binding-like
MTGFPGSRAVSALAQRARIIPLVAAVAFAGLFTASCDVHGVSEPGTLSAISISPNPQLMAINGTQQFTAVGTDHSGAAVVIHPTWSVAAGGGTIGSSGLFTAGTLSGSYLNTITASSGGMSATATVVVGPGPLATIVVTPNPVLMGSGTAQQFIALGRDSSGNLVPFTPTWSVVAGGGTLTGTGLFTAGQPAGTYANTVQASSNTIKGAATVTVVPGALAAITITPSPDTMIVSATQQFTAVGHDITGNVIAIAPVWSVTNGGGTIGTAGQFTAGTTPGTYSGTIKATSGTISSTATVVVTVGPLARITVSPTPATMVIASTQQFTAVGTDVGGNVLAISPTWTIVAGGGTVGPTGVFTAGTTTGTYTNTIRASSAGIAGFATAIVTSGPLASITVTPNPVSVQANTTQQFIAVGRDASNNVFLINPTWSVVNGGGAIGASSGLFTAGATAGAYANTIQATSGAISGTATVTVTAVAPPPSLVNLGTAAPNGIMAGQSVTCITGGTINADVSISPGNTLTGFGPCVITGVQHLADAVALQGQTDLTAAYNTLFGLPCPPANAIVADLGGTTKPAGVYCTASGIGVTGTLTLDGGGDPNATFVFQAGTSLITAGNIVLINGAQAKNVYWLVGTSATLGTASQWQGNILALTSITLVDNANLIGRALARNGSVTLGTNNVITLP